MDPKKKCEFLLQESHAGEEEKFTSWRGNLSSGKRSHTFLTAGDKTETQKVVGQQWASKRCAHLFKLQGPED